MKKHLVQYNTRNIDRDPFRPFVRNPLDPHLKSTFETGTSIKDKRVLRDSNDYQMFLEHTYIRTTV